MLNSTKIDESSFVQNIHSSAAGDQIIVDEPTKSVEPTIVEEQTKSVEEPTKSVEPAIVEEPTEPVEPSIVDEPTKSIELPIVDEPTNDTHNSKHENIYKYAFHFYSLQTINNTLNSVFLPCDVFRYV